jgi:hypothetical protein
MTKDVHDLIAIDDFAIFSDGKASIGIAIESESDIEFAFFDELLEFLNMSRTTAFVGVKAVWLIADDGDIGA